MATPAPNSGANGVGNTTTTSTAAQAQPAPSAAAPPQQQRLYDGGPGLFVNDDEALLYQRWLTLPHPHLNISTFLSHFPYSPDDPLHHQTEVEASITPEQERRFGFVAQHCDIRLVMTKLVAFASEVCEVYEGLAAEMMEALDLDRDGTLERLRSDMLRRERERNDER